MLKFDSPCASVSQRLFLKKNVFSERFSALSKQQFVRGFPYRCSDLNRESFFALFFCAKTPDPLSKVGKQNPILQRFSIHRTKSLLQWESFLSTLDRGSGVFHLIFFLYLSHYTCTHFRSEKTR